MRVRLVEFCAVLSFVLVAMLGANVASAAEQTQKSEVINFEVLSVDGNVLVLRDQNGTRELTVPDDFRFTVDGASKSVHELVVGMKGTATITTTTTVRPVFVTDIKHGKVVRRLGDTVIVQSDDVTRRFTQSEVDQRGLEIFMDGKPIKLWQLKEGDYVTATIVTSAAPEVLTEREVEATLAMPEPAETPPVAAAPVEQPAPQPAAAAPSEPAPSEPAPMATPTPAPVVASPPPAESNEKLWLIVGGIALVIIVLAVIIMRRRS